MKLPDFEIIKVLNLKELNDKRDIEISNISNISDNITVSEIYESDISYSFRVFNFGWTIKFYELRK